MWNHFQDADKNHAHNHTADELPGFSGVAHQPLTDNGTNHQLGAEQSQQPQKKSGDADGQAHYGNARNNCGYGNSKHNQNAEPKGGTVTFRGVRGIQIA